MRKFLKQLFCGHIFTVKEIKLLYIYKEYWYGRINARYKVSALYKECLKCGKKEITEQKSFDGLIDERELWGG